MTARRRWALGAVLLTLVAVSAGCGGDSEPQAAPTVTVALPPAAPAATATAPPPATTSTPHNEQRKTTRQPAPQPVSAPIRCLRRAGLSRARERSDGIWGARVSKGRLVYVDGPYEKPADARASAASLEAVQSAVAGGLYVVSASLRDRVDAEVSAVASCLRRAPTP